MNQLTCYAQLDPLRACTSKATFSEWLSTAQSLIHEWRIGAKPELLEGVRDDSPWHKGMRGWLLLHHAYQDELHRRGQLYAIARLLGRSPPAVFAEERPEYWDSRKGR